MNVVSRTYRRLRHRRGHGIHSPLVYSLAREVFPRKRGKTLAAPELYGELLTKGVSRSAAAEIARLYDHMGLQGFSFVSAPPSPALAERLYLCFDPRPLQAGYDKAVFCLLRGTPGSVNALRIDRRGYVLCFFDPGLPVQHFVL